LLVVVATPAGMEQASTNDSPSKAEGTSTDGAPTSLVGSEGKSPSSSSSPPHKKPPKAKKNSPHKSNAVPSKVDSVEEPPLTGAALESEVVRQIEYYFSDENLPKDKFMQKNLDKEGFMTVETLATFPKLKKRGIDCDFIKNALKQSTILDVHEDGTKVKRKVPMREESRTIYVSYLPKDSDRESVSGIFGTCGTIKRIDLPTDKETGVIKGIAFVEFETKEEVQNALKLFSRKDNLYHQAGIRVKPYVQKQDFTIPFSSNNNNNHNHTNGNSNHTNGHAKAEAVVQHSIYDSSPVISYSSTKIKERKPKANNSQTDNWEPDPASLAMRPKLVLKPRSATDVAGLSPCRQPFGPEPGKGKGFGAGRGKLVGSPIPSPRTLQVAHQLPQQQELPHANAT